MRKYTPCENTRQAISAKTAETSECNKVFSWRVRRQRTPNVTFVLQFMICVLIEEQEGRSKQAIRLFTPHIQFFACYPNAAYSSTNACRHILLLPSDRIVPLAWVIARPAINMKRLITVSALRRFTPCLVNFAPVRSAAGCAIMRGMLKARAASFRTAAFVSKTDACPVKNVADGYNHTFFSISTLASMLNADFRPSKSR